MNKCAFGMGLSAIVLVTSSSFARNQSKTEKSAMQNSYDYSELAKAPEKARVRLNPLETDPDAIVAGQILFEDHCQECHGPSAVGGKKGPSLREPQVQNATPGTLFWLLTSGVARKGMPVWSKLPEAQRWQLVRYLKSLGVKADTTSGERP